MYFLWHGHFIFDWELYECKTRWIFIYKSHKYMNKISFNYYVVTSNNNNYDNIITIFRFYGMVRFKVGFRSADVIIL